MACDMTPEDIEVSVNLEDQSLHHIDFLVTVDSVPELKQLPVLRRAMYRYERFWLPLAAEHNRECLSAPLDIEWVWHCHMLSPLTYAEDCLTITNTIVNHTLRSLQEYDNAVGKSRQYWQQKYGTNDTVPFQVDYQIHPQPPVPDDFKSKITYNIIEAAGRQKTFYYQVSLPHYRDLKFMRRSLFRYRQFLFLKKSYPTCFCVPCFEMDLMWHSHQVNPVLYREDTDKLLGHVLNHDDSTNDRSEGSTQYVAEQETAQYWHELFHESYHSAGGMYRGPPPGGVLYRLSEDDINRYSTKSTTLILTRINFVLSKSAKLDEYKNVKITCYACAGQRMLKKLCSLRSKITNKTDRGFVFHINEASFSFDTRIMNGVKLVFETISGKFACVQKPRELVGEAVFNVLSAVEHHVGNGNGAFESEQELLDGCCVSIHGIFTTPVAGGTLLFLQTGTEETFVIPDNVQDLLGPTHIERLHCGADRRCQITTIGMKDHMRRDEFTCKVLYIPALRQHVVQIFYHGHMVSLGHPILCDQLPSPLQVEKDMITLDHRDGERAMLIKNHAGDWAIIKGKRVTEKTGNGTVGPCHLSLYLYKMLTHAGERVSLDPARRSCILDGTKVDLGKGVIEVEKPSLEVGERIALAFCVSVLHKLLVPNMKS